MISINGNQVSVRWTSGLNTGVATPVEIYRVPFGSYLYVTAASISRTNLSGTLIIVLGFIPQGFDKLLPNIANFKPQVFTFLSLQNAQIAQFGVVYLKRSLVIPELSSVVVSASSTGFGIGDPFVTLDGFLRRNEMPLPRLGV